MFQLKGRRALSAVLAAGLVGVAAQSALADAPAPSKSELMARNLIKALVAKGVLDQTQADAIVANAEAETAAQAVQAEVKPSSAGATVVDDQAGVRISYIPKPVRDQIEAQVRDEVVEKAKSERWATPNAFPDWVSRITVSGDLRMRDEGRFFDKRNANDFINYNAIDTGSPYDVSTGLNPPIMNSLQDRNLLRVRARLGVTAAVTDEFSASVRLGTGSDNQPVSDAQTLNSDFTKKDIWLDRAYFAYAARKGSLFDGLQASVGRMDNPFRSTEIVWKQDDLGFEGMWGSYQHAAPLIPGLKGFALLGAFPLDPLDTYLPTATADKKPSDAKDKWLAAAQVGGDYEHGRSTFSLAAAYYDYINNQGVLSTPCLNTSDYCSTDYSRPAFMQKGNTLFAIRNLYYTDPSKANSVPQYFGLASKFQDLDILATYDWRISDALHVRFTADYVKNLGYNAAAIKALNPVTNVDTCTAYDKSGACTQTVFKSGDTAWLARLQVGAPGRPAAFGQWQASVAYLYIQPDAVVDAYDDADFREGGTNSKGFILYGAYGLTRNSWVSARWLSADAIYGEHFSVDVMQLDLNAKF